MFQLAQFSLGLRLNSLERHVYDGIVPLKVVPEDSDEESDSDSNSDDEPLKEELPVVDRDSAEERDSAKQGGNEISALAMAELVDSRVDAMEMRIMALESSTAMDSMEKRLIHVENEFFRYLDSQTKNIRMMIIPGLESILFSGN